jgi:hypothetical protein
MIGDMKKRTRLALGWGIAVIVVVLVVWGVVMKWPKAPEKPVIPAGWQNYANAEYGFSLAYPADWQVNTSQLQNDVPAVLFGNPIEGTTTYTLRVSMEKNDGKLSSAGCVENMLAKMQIDDQTNGTNTPSVMVQFEHASGTPLAENNGYELYNVFEFDHNAEQVYVAHDDKILVFDFPLAEANPNIASSTENNAIAHEILATLEFGK